MIGFVSQIDIFFCFIYFHHSYFFQDDVQFLWMCCIKVVDPCASLH